MVVRIIRREAPPEEKVVSQALPVSPSNVTRPVLKKTLKLGTSEIRPDLDLHYEQGKVKFLVNLRKPLWYKVVDFDEEGKQTLKMASEDGNTFMSKVGGTVSRNYMVVVELEGAASPSEDSLKMVQGILSKSGVTEGGATESLKESPITGKENPMSKDKQKKESKKPAKTPVKKGK